MATGDTFKCSVLMSHATNNTAFVFDYGYRDGAGGTVHLDTATLAADFRALIRTKLLAVMLDSVVIQRWRAACVASTHGFKGEVGFYQETSPPAGSLDSTDSLPQEIAISIKRWTGYSSGHDRGRIFFGPVGASLRDIGNSDRCDTTNVALQTFAGTVSSGLTTATIPLDPVILAADGSFSGHTIIGAAIAGEFVHHKSRRQRVGA